MFRTPADGGCHLAGTGDLARLERRLASFYGMKYAVCVSNATTALLVTAIALGVRNSEFLTTPITWGGSLSPWLLLGNRPLFGDVNPVTLTLDASSLRSQMTSNVRAVMAADIFGNPSDDEALRQFADRNGIWYIADAAQSLGARRNGRPASSLAHALVVSFTAGKTVEAGEGGAIITSDEELYDRLIWWGQHPLRQARHLQAENQFALNARMHPAAAKRAINSFDRALRALRARQLRAYAITETLNQSGLVEPCNHSLSELEPTFHTFTAAWRTAPRPNELCEYVRAAGHEIRCSPFPVKLLYEDPAFVSIWPAFVPRNSAQNPNARAQARCRFGIDIMGNREVRA